MHPLLQPVSIIPKVGPKRLEALAKAQIKTLYDLLCFLPKAYEDRRACHAIGQLQAGVYSVLKASVLRMRIQKGRSKRRLELIMRDTTGILKLVFFHSPYHKPEEQFHPEQTWTICGVPESFSGSFQMVHPKLLPGDQVKQQEGLWPVYPEVEGVYPNDLHQMIHFALKVAFESSWQDVVSNTACEQIGISSLKEAFQQIHVPSKADHDKLFSRETAAFYRMAWDELLHFQLAVLKRRRPEIQQSSYAIVQKDVDSVARMLFPFELTGAQKRVLKDIAKDLVRPVPMARLVQGDVGCGKTAVSAVAAYMAVESGLQCALMAPTEILAEQHHRTFQQWFMPLGVEVGLLVGKQTEQERKKVLHKLKSHQIKIVIGTHALISESVAFAALGLCIVDEQHRFGVTQRFLLRDKGVHGLQVPHVLAMTATPIPRSLALTLYGDLDLSVIDELPKGRQAIQTKILKGHPQEVLLRLMERVHLKGKKAYVIYPLVEESEHLDLEDATSGFQHIASVFGADRVGLLHGKMKSAEKERIMAAFAQGTLKVLVSTTVVEVGVHVEDATVMAIVHPERFGLSQLHQLRGRVGRGTEESFCFLITSSFFSQSDMGRRLKILEESNDGFRIAAEDLAIRGAGDFLGTRQSGMPLFRTLDFAKHSHLVEPARQLAFRILEQDPKMADPALQLYHAKGARVEMS